MKICIIGPCSTGKSTLAKQLSQQLNVVDYNLDAFYIDFDSITASNRSVFDRKIIENKIDEVLNKKDWIVEGPYFEKKLLDEADIVVFTPRNLVTALVWQWKRFFTDPIQIQKWGVVNNLLLSKLIIGQYLEKSDFYLFQDVRYPTLRFLKEKLGEKKYRNKVQIMEKRNSIPVLK